MVTSTKMQVVTTSFFVQHTSDSYFIERHYRYKFGDKHQDRIASTHDGACRGGMGWQWGSQFTQMSSYRIWELKRQPQTDDAVDST